MSKRICVYTCITGDYDDLHDIKVKDKNVDYICFTNNPKLKSKTWKIIRIQNQGLDNCRLARKIKTIGHPTINKNYDISVWVDGLVVWDKLPSEFVNTYLKNAPLAVFKHCTRDSVHDEAIACLKMRKDTKETILKTLDYLKKEGFPDNCGLCESTVYIKRHNDPVVKKTMELWFELIENLSRRDQLSFNYAAWKSNLNFSYINLSVWNNNWFTTVGHNPKTEINDCHIYYGDLRQEFDFNKYYIYKYHKTENHYRLTVNIPISTNVIELNFSDIIGTNFKNLIVEPKYNRIEFNRIVKYEKNTVCCSGCSTMRIYGKYNKNQKLHLSIDMRIMRQGELDGLIAYQSVFNELLSNQLLSSQQTVNALQNEINSIYSSKSWKIISKVKKFIPRRPKQS